MQLRSKITLRVRSGNSPIIKAKSRQITKKTPKTNPKDEDRDEIVFEERKGKKLTFDFLQSEVETEVHLNKASTSKFEPRSDLQSNLSEDKAVLDFMELDVNQSKSSTLKLEARSDLLPNQSGDDLVRRLFNAGCHTILDNLFMNLTKSEIETWRSASTDWNCIIMFYLGLRVNRIEKIFMRKITSMDQIEKASLDFPQFENHVKFEHFFKYVLSLRLHKNKASMRKSI
jgi:hypothetical protein